MSGARRISTPLAASLVVALLAPASAHAASGWVTRSILHHRAQCPFCPDVSWPAGRDCTDALYLESADFDRTAPVRNVLVYILDQDGTVIGTGSTSQTGSYLINWYSPTLPTSASLQWKAQHRPASEWQGMRVDMTHRQVCDRSSTCGLALACLEDGHCGPCRQHSQCAADESCLLDHCVPRANVGCRVASDCGDDRRCMLSGYTPRGRGNDDMLLLRTSGGSDAAPRRWPDQEGAGMTHAFREAGRPAAIGLVVLLCSSTWTSCAASHGELDGESRCRRCATGPTRSESW